MLGHHHRALAVDGSPANLEVALHKSRYLIVSELLALEDHSQGLGLGDDFLSCVNGSVLIAQYDDCRGRRIGEILLQSLQSLEVLCLLHHNESSPGHHRVAPRHVHYLRHIDIGPEHHILIEVALVGRQSVLCYAVGNLVDVIRLRTH